MSENAVDIKGLNKTYKASGRAPAKVALEDVDLSIPKGSIFGLLGPNGAGKSTIINIMAGLVIKSSGSVRIWGFDLDHEQRCVKSAIGVVPQEINNDWFFSPRQTLDIQAGMYGVPKAERDVMQILRTVGLEDKAEVNSRSLSGGMKRRLMIAKAMVHSPPILVLDEPTAGVNIELRRHLWDNVRALNAQGVTILLTTHYLEEAEELCDKIAIINHGKIIACEDKEDLVGRLENKEIRFRLDRPFEDVPPALERFCALREGRRTLMIRYSPSEQNVGEIIEAIQKAGYGIADVSTEESDLEDVFLQLTGSG